MADDRTGGSGEALRSIVRCRSGDGGHAPPSPELVPALVAVMAVVDLDHTMSEIEDRNHALFLAHLDESEKAVWWIAYWLHRGGYHVKINASPRAPRRMEWRGYADLGDLEVSQRVEVKQLSAEFSGPQDWPFHDFIVCAKHSWDRAVPKPFAFFILSRSARAVAMVKSESRPTWTTCIRRDRRYEGVTQEYYRAPLNQVKFFALGDGQ